MSPSQDCNGREESGAVGLDGLFSIGDACKAVFSSA